ncbi:RNA methyltransferase [bacterium]|nr:RNA methyltransferase [bacterium]
MSIVKIDSPHNPKYKRLLSLLTDSKGRRKAGQFVIEGRRYVEEAIAHRPESIDVTIGIDVESPMANTHWILSQSLLKKASILGNSDGAMAIVNRPLYPPFSHLGVRLGLILDGIQNPSNMGAIVRNAVAFGVDEVIITPGSCDPFHPEAIRAMAGNWYQIPIRTLDVSSWSTPPDEIEWVILDRSGQRGFSDIRTDRPCWVVIGSEGNGLVTPFLKDKRRNHSVSIQMDNKVESLNAAVTSGIVLHYLSMSKAPQ